MPDQSLSGQFTEPNELLDDLKEIVDTRVKLTDEEQVVADKITPHLKAIAKTEVRKELEVVLVNRQDEFNEKLRVATLDLTRQNIEQWKKDHEPLKPNDVQALLNIEYLEFEVNIKDPRTRQVKQFVIAELVESREEKLVKMLQKHLLPHVHKLAAVDWTVLQSQAEQIEALLGIIPDFLQSMAETVAVCLDPYEEHKVDKAWVLENVSSKRMMNIILAQAAANRYRDFLSDGSQLLKTFQTT